MASRSMGSKPGTDTARPRIAKRCSSPSVGPLVHVHRRTPHIPIGERSMALDPTRPHVRQPHAMTARTKVINKLPTAALGLTHPRRRVASSLSTSSRARRGVARHPRTVTFRQCHGRRPALYFTILGEPALKMLRYQQRTISTMRARWVALLLHQPERGGAQGDWNAVLRRSSRS
jgi:hypothetical protein